MKNNLITVISLLYLRISFTNQSTKIGTWAAPSPPPPLVKNNQGFKCEYFKIN